jgi:hypothetical protein
VPWPDVQKRYATDVRRVDAAVGDLMQLLKDLKIDNNTLVVFTSDNGPSRESYLKDEPYEPDFFHGFGPFDGIKRDTLQGGVREPTFVRWPGHVRSGAVDRTPTGQWDWLATFAEAAGQAVPAASDGVSLLPLLTGRGQLQRPSALYIEYFNGQRTPTYDTFVAAHRDRVRQQMQTLIVDGYIGLRTNIKSADDDFEIYDIEKDPQQAHNLARDPGMTEVQQRMKARALQARRPDAGAPRPYDNAAVPAVTPGKLEQGKIHYQTYAGQWPWVPDHRNLKAATQGVTEKISATVCPETAGGGALFEGYFNAPTEGEYTFVASSDGGTEVFLHDCRVVDDDFGRSGAPVSGKIRLAAGWHPLRVHYRHAQSTRQLSLEYSGPGISQQVVPPDALGISQR